MFKRICIFFYLLLTVFSIPLLLPRNLNDFQSGCSTGIKSIRLLNGRSNEKEWKLITESNQSYFNMDLFTTTQGQTLLWNILDFLSF
ncbi:hypothetical protein K502DRAFT_119921 [Neoconidiobolus thromboides FSU 785]|nr:hypothetical protein K502DRAFT_119921 [Neoconidiobolus thromboides FSU 785]